MDYIQWLSQIGTNDIIKGIWSNNWMLITIVGAPVLAWLKGKYPDYYAKLATMLPGVGKPNKIL